MIDMLSDLHDCSPSMRCELLFAVVTLSIHFNELSDKGLLYFGIIIELFFNSYLQFDSF
jgi:hypothetical protein